jgi:hypothetical protein
MVYDRKVMRGATGRAVKDVNEIEIDHHHAEKVYTAPSSPSS